MRVAVFRADSTHYPEQPPFHPAFQYPELSHAGINDTLSSNPVYHAVRGTLAVFGLDSSHFGTPDWNPLKAYIQPGDKILIKPNFVLHEFGAFVGTNCLTTHGSIIRAVVDYAYLAGGPEKLHHHRRCVTARGRFRADCAKVGHVRSPGILLAKMSL